MKNVDILKYEKIYREGLLNDVLPFWEKHSVDHEMGGYFTCLDRDGTVYDTDKFMWLQARQICTFSMLYNNIESRKSWLDIAKHGVDFIRQHGQDQNGDWYFALDRAGRPLVSAYSIFSDCFAVLALAEYARAAEDESMRELALSTYWRIQARKENPKGVFNKHIRETRKIMSLALPMITIGMTTEINKLFPDPEFEKVIDENLHLIMNVFVNQKLKTVFEHPNPDGSHSDNMNGRLLNPGHALEAMWFILEVAREKNDTALIQKAAEASLWTIERGWDKDFGGIFYYLDYQGLPPEKLEWNMKLWWVHLEALYTFSLAHHLTGEAVFEEWFRKIHDYAWAHFPDSEFGEWYGYLDRRGEITHSLKGSKWKGCFHVPRALFLCAQLFREMAD